MKIKLDIQKFILQEASTVIVPIIDYLANGNVHSEMLLLYYLKDHYRKILKWTDFHNSVGSKILNLIYIPSEYGLQTLDRSEFWGLHYFDLLMQFKNIFALC